MLRLHIQCSSAVAAVLFATALTAPLTTQHNNMSLVSQVVEAPCTTGDVWAIGERYMLLARRYKGFTIIDCLDPKNPITKDITPPNYPASTSNYGVGDIKSDGRYIFATNESSGGGVFVYDTASSVMNPSFVTHITHSRINRGVHNCWVDGTTLYCVSNGTRKIEVFDISTLTQPVFLATLGQGISGAGAHDVTVIDKRAYCSLWAGGFAIYDMTAPGNPVLLGKKNYPSAANHNAWPTNDKRYLYTTDENDPGGIGGSVRIWDISQLPAITQVGQYKAPGAKTSIVHNVQVVGDYLLTTYYKEGIRIASIKNDPTKPVEIAHYDTFAPTGGGCFWSPKYAGCWGVYPFNHRKMFVSDLDSGGYILDLDVVSQQFTAKATTVPIGSTIDLNFSFKSHVTTTDINAFGVAIISSVNGSPAFYPVLIDGRNLAASQSSPTHAISIPVPIGLPPMTIGFTAYSGLLDPVQFTAEADIKVQLK